MELVLTKSCHCNTQKSWERQKEHAARAVSQLLLVGRLEDAVALPRCHWSEHQYKRRMKGNDELEEEKQGRRTWWLIFCTVAVDTASSSCFWKSAT